MIEPPSALSRRKMAMRWLWGAAALAGLSSVSASAQEAELDTGQRLYMTSCGLCHAAPDLINKAPGPALNHTTLNGNAEDIATFIKTGTERMPSFRYTYSDAEIGAIARYITTIPGEAAK